MNKYNKEYLKEKMEDFRAFRNGMKNAGFDRYVVDLQTAIMLYSMWSR